MDHLVFKLSSLCAVMLVLVGVVVAQDPWASTGMKVYCNKEVYMRSASKPGCVTEKFKIHACLGLCKSYVVLSDSHPFFSNRCQCCKSSQTSVQTFQFSQCDSGVDRSVTMESAAICACQNSAC